MPGKKREWDTGRARQLLEAEGKDVVAVADMVGTTVPALLAWMRAENIKVADYQRTDRKTAATTEVAVVEDPPVEDDPEDPTVKAAKAFDESMKKPAEPQPVEAIDDRPVDLNFSLNQLELRLKAPSMEGAIRLLESVLHIVREGTE